MGEEKSVVGVGGGGVKGVRGMGWGLVRGRYSKNNLILSYLMEPTWCINKISVINDV